MILGDSNLNIDLPFGVQSISVSSAVAHEDFSREERGAGNDIGLIRMKEPAEMTKTVCLLCLPASTTGYSRRNCTAISYGTKVLQMKEEDGRFRGEEKNLHTVDCLRVFSFSNFISPASSITDDSVGILRTSEYPALHSELCGENAREDLLCYGEEGFDKEEDCTVNSEREYN